MCSFCSLPRKKCKRYAAMESASSFKKCKRYGILKQWVSRQGWCYYAHMQCLLAIKLSGCVRTPARVRWYKDEPIPKTGKNLAFKCTYAAMCRKFKVASVVFIMQQSPAVPQTGRASSLVHWKVTELLSNVLPYTTGTLTIPDWVTAWFW